MNGGMPHDALAAARELEVLGLAQATRAVLGDPLTPKTGIGFVIDVERVFGMPQISMPSAPSLVDARTNSALPTTCDAQRRAAESARGAMLY